MRLLKQTVLCLLAVIGILALPVIGLSADRGTGKGQKKGVIKGRIMIADGGPLAGGQVLFFNADAGPAPAPEQFDRTPDYVRDINDEGWFTAEIPAGRYYLGATKKISGEPVGPPQEGDYVWRSVDKNGKPRIYKVRPGKKFDIGIVGGAAPMQQGIISKRPVMTAIEGTVMDPDGNPVPGVVVVAFLNPNTGSKPVYISEKSDAKGHYLLRVSEGTYYLRARNEYSSGPPEPGQIVGFYGEGSPSPVPIVRGQIKEHVDFQVILFPGRGPASGAQP